MKDNCQIVYLLVLVFGFSCMVFSSLSTSSSFVVIPRCNDKMGNEDLLSMENTNSLIECALSCNTDCVCFGFHWGQKLCRRQARCHPSRMNLSEMGWLYYLPSTVYDTGWKCNSETHRCYSLDLKKLTEEEAMHSCYMRNSYLVEINDLEENTWITDNHLRHVACSNRYDCTTWTGGIDKEREGVYVWEHSNTPIGFTNWGSGNPDNYAAPMKDIDCIDIFYNGKWNDRRCTKLNAFLCERENLE